jgi:hypothetical protein
VREFGLVCFVDATGVDPKVLQAILSSLFSAEPDLLITRLVLTRAIRQVIKGDLLSVRSPGV